MEMAIGLLLLIACSALIASVCCCLFTRTWLAVLLTAVLAPYVHLHLARAISGHSDPQDGLTFIFGQVVIIPVALLVSAVFADNRGWRRRGNAP